MNSPNETEVKIPVHDPEHIVAKILNAGFQESVVRQFEANTLYDSSEKTLRAQQMMLRLREVGGASKITWKGASQPGPHKSRPELETSVGSKDILHAILTEIGFSPSFRYEKFRTEFQKPEIEGVITVDETPIGWYLELEGSGEWIDRTAMDLGFSSENYVLESYGKLYLAECERRGETPGNMVFAKEIEAV